MSNVIDRINQEIYQEIRAGVPVESDNRSKVSGIRKYLSYYEKGQVFDVVFTSVDPDANFSTVDEQVKVVLTNEEFMKYATGSSTYATANLLGVTMQAKVVSIEEANAKVYVTLAGATKLSYEANLRDAINAEFFRSLANGQKPVVWGVIKKVSQEKVLVNLLGKNVLGIISRRSWSKDHVITLEAVCKEGEFYQFEVTKPAPSYAGKSQAWYLSRRNLTKSTWDQVDEEGLKEDGVILVTCINKPVGKTYWWGKSDRLPGVNILGDFTSAFPNERHIFVGITYKCKIRRFDPENKKISVKPFEVIPADLPKVERMRSLYKSAPSIQ